ncbi:integrin alpha-PS1-like [Watersipora subatra]|uniref:integrin alpha-PS1-like n=1 Tax=Watersipora subatra TaxID=2589382 RepID=UPI00355B67AC
MAESFGRILVFCYALVVNSYTFNIDMKYAIVKEAPQADFYFGYSVAQHSKNDDELHNEILVGAPQADSAGQFLDGFERTGALFSCPVNLQNDQSKTDGCYELPYPDSSNLINNYNRDLKMAENKTDMWLGVNIRSAGAGKKVVACGHRYKIVEESVNVYGLGVCYYYNSDLTLTSEDNSQLPCSGENLVGGQLNSVTGEFGLCAAGMGLAAVDNDIIYGLPGAVTWRGSAYWTKSAPSLKDIPINEKVDPTPEDGTKPVTSPYAYLGSSAIIVVNLLNERKKVAVVGAPRQKDNGAALIFSLNQQDSDFVEKKRFKGDQFNSGFGHSVAAVDILMDEHPSLLVGAPYYRPNAAKDKDSSRMISGAVYIYYNYGYGVQTSHEIITPDACPYGISITECNNAQFGYAVITLGDVNGDGRQDVAIGAPFYGKGAVYIYNGMSNKKLSSKASQVIMASELNFNFLNRQISGFGIALSGGHNMDGQGHTDILVGAHDSSHVIVLRSRPVITINGDVNIITSEIKLKEPECVEIGTNQQCIDYQMCFNASFTDSSRNSAIEVITIEYTLIGDSGYEFPNNRRVDFKSKDDQLQSVKTGTKNISVDRQQICESQRVYLLQTGNLLNPVEFKLTYTLAAPSSVQYENINTYPIIDTYASSASTASIDFERQCMTDTCETDLAVSAMFTDVENVIAIPVPSVPGTEEYVFDSNMVEKLELAVKLKVDGSRDRAYFSVLRVSLPPELSYTGVASTDDESTSCSGDEETNTIACTFGRSILQGEDREVKLSLDYRDLGPAFATINITGSTQSTDILLDNNMAELKIKVNIVTDLELLGSATKGDNVEYGGDSIIKGASAMTRDDEIGQLIQHTYTIINSGSYGAVSKVNLVVQWPYEIAATGEYLLYMTTFPKHDFPPGKGQCAVAEKYINSLGLQIVDELTNVDDSTTQRYKRQVSQEDVELKTAASSTGPARTVAQLNCYDGSARCFDTTCEFFDVNPGDVIRVRFNSRLWNSSLVNVYSDVDVVQIISTGQLTIDPSAVVSQTNLTNDGRNVTTEAVSISRATDKNKPIPIWIYVVAAAAGLLLLVIIILVCWKCGFFKRDRPQMHAAKVERQKEGAKYSEVPQADPEHMT